jgi:hypothetical protein
MDELEPVAKDTDQSVRVSKTSLEGNVRKGTWLAWSESVR